MSNPRGFRKSFPRFEAKGTKMIMRLEVKIFRSFTVELDVFQPHRLRAKLGIINYHKEMRAMHHCFFFAPLKLPNSPHPAD